MSIGRSMVSLSSWPHSLQDLRVHSRLDYRPMSAPTSRARAVLQRHPVMEAPVGSIAISDDEGHTYAFRIISGTLPVLPLKVTFKGAAGVYYIDLKDSEQTRHPLMLEDWGFAPPQDGWQTRDRCYFVKQTRLKRSTRLEKLYRRFLAVTHGVKIYPDLMRSREGSVVAAIDFGSAYTGYAFAFRSSPRQIYTNTWLAEGISFNTEKAPTTILMFPNGDFHSFGYDAEDEYARLSESDSSSGWYYFRNFKMKLWAAQDLRRNSVLRDVEGKPMEAVRIFAMAIRYLKERMEKNILKKRPEMPLDEIVWVLSVPALWSDAARQFMREAATKAGIDNDLLRLVLEPEAASMYCKDRDLSKLRSFNEREKKTLVPGDKYILLDLGGGTCDVSAHEILDDGNLREIHTATGHALGGIAVDESFMKFLSELVGRESMLLLQRDEACQYLDLQREFETKKRMGIRPHENVVLRLPNSLLEFMTEITSRTLEEAVQDSLFADRMKVKHDKLMLDGYMMLEIFDDTVEGIVKYIKQVKHFESLQGVNKLILTGGFSESRYIRKAIQRAFPEDCILTPVHAGLAVLKGAVLMGSLPGVIVERISRYTYGVNYAKPFEPGVHSEAFKETRNGRDYCDNLFEKLIEVGQPIRTSDTFTLKRSTRLVDRKSKRTNLYTKLYISTEKDPMYCTRNEGCTKVGEIVRRPPRNGWPDIVQSLIEIKFGEAELCVRVHETDTGAQYEARIDCL